VVVVHVDCQEPLERLAQRTPLGRRVGPSLHFAQPTPAEQARQPPQNRLLAMLIHGTYLRYLSVLNVTVRRAQGD